MVHMLSPVAHAAHSHVGPSPRGEAFGRHLSWNAVAPNVVCGFVQGIQEKRTVLIVEDDPVLRRAMTEHVARMDVRVLTASHYAAALAHLASATPDLVCVDIGLPTESGYELCEYIRGPLGLRIMPIMVTSESGSPEDMAYAEEAGANAFLGKPFSMHELGAQVEALLDRLWPSTAHMFQLGPQPRSRI